MRKYAPSFLIVCMFLLVTVIPVKATSFSFDVYAYQNATLNSPLDTGIFLNAGEHFGVVVNPNDLWSAGPEIPAGPDTPAITRISNADGLGPNGPYGDLVDIWQTGSTARFHYGALVGQIDSGDYFLVGNNFEGFAVNAGNLKLLYWDGFYIDNSGFVTAKVHIPEPATMLLLGLGLMGVLGIRRKFRK